MPTRNETVQDEDRGWLGPAAASVYGWSLAGMVATGAKTGYYVPGTVAPGRALAHKFGRKPSMKFGATKGWRSGINKMGVIRSTRHLGAGSTFGQSALKMTSSATQRALFKNVVGRVAGFGLKALGWQFSLMAGGAAVNVLRGAAEQGRRKRVSGFTGSFNYTKESLTSRQRAERAISGSRLQARSAIGNEAMLMHR